jgi:hypothetical protein
VLSTLKVEVQQLEIDAEGHPSMASVQRQICPHPWHHIIKMNEMNGWLKVPATLPLGKEPQRPIV